MSYLLGAKKGQGETEAKEKRLTGETDLVAHHSLHRLFAVAAAAPLDDLSYLAHVKDLPGKNTCLTDNTLRDLIMRPPTGNNVAVRNFDKDVLNTAFTMQPGPVPGYTAEDLGADDLARSIEDSKRDSLSSHHQSHPPLRKIIATMSHLAPIPTTNGSGSVPQLTKSTPRHHSSLSQPPPPSQPLPQPSQPPTKIKLKLGIGSLSSNAHAASVYTGTGTGTLAGLSSMNGMNGGGVGGTVSSPYLTMGDYGDTEKKKKKKRRHEEDDGADGMVIDDGTGEPRKKKKKKKHSHHEHGTVAAKVDHHEEEDIEIDIL
ncbi:UNVERIFIED_CONTAM: hypothetical protein HDU68_011851 [Siphonaria sp. JEL0065]|nr:hypothetical protein HDU68_011851 [Siphonaria sp. JEL0065]